MNAACIYSYLSHGRRDAARSMPANKLYSVYAAQLHFIYMSSLTGYPQLSLYYRKPNVAQHHAGFETWGVAILRPA